MAWHEIFLVFLWDKWDLFLFLSPSFFFFPKPFSALFFFACTCTCTFSFSCLLSLTLSLLKHTHYHHYHYFLFLHPFSSHASRMFENFVMMEREGETGTDINHMLSFFIPMIFGGIIHCNDFPSRNDDILIQEDDRGMAPSSPLPFPWWKDTHTHTHTFTCTAFSPKQRQTVTLCRPLPYASIPIQDGSPCPCPFLPPPQSVCLISFPPPPPFNTSFLPSPSHNGNLLHTWKQTDHSLPSLPGFLGNWDWFGFSKSSLALFMETGTRWVHPPQITSPYYVCNVVIRIFFLPQWLPP